MRIAIDGPAGAGKSSTGSLLARRLGFRFLDTGLMYRAFALAAVRDGVTPGNITDLPNLMKRVSIEAASGPRGEQIVLLGGGDVTASLHSPQVNEAVSQFAAVPEVRTVMVASQRQIAGAGNIVMAGRDIGTDVLPDAELKVFLTASPEARLGRRLADSPGATGASQNDVARNLAQRDKLDTSRAASPLRPAEDAIVIDTEQIDLAEVVAELELLAQARILAGNKAG